MTLFCKMKAFDGMMAGLVFGVSGLLYAGPVEDHNAAKQAQRAGDHQKAYELFQRCAKQEKYPNFVFSARYQCAYSAISRNEFSECETYARAAIDLFESGPEGDYFQRKEVRRNYIEMYGLLDRSARAAFRVGEGWDYQHRVVELWSESRGDVSGAHIIAPEAVAKFPNKERGYGWRLICREATYLHDVGRTDEARQLLLKALKLATRDLNSQDDRLSTYSILLLRNLSMIEGFVGYEKRAMDYSEREIALLEKAGSKRMESLLGAKINFISARVDLMGGTAEDLEEAQKIRDEGRKHGIQLERSFLAIKERVENAIIQREAYEKLASEHAEGGDILEAFYVSRNSLFQRAQSGEAGLDEEFLVMLEEVRNSGMKRSEPRVYRRYGDWLRNQKRYDEALGIYREALRMTRAFGWNPLVIIIQARLGMTYFEMGQREMALAIWQEMDAFINAHPDIPGEIVLRAWGWPLAAYVRANMAGPARTLAARARGLKNRGIVSETRLLNFQENLLEKALLARAESKERVTSPVVSRKDGAILQPIRMTHVALPGQSATGTFHLMNRSVEALTGKLTVSGRGVSKAKEELSFIGDLSGAQQQITTLVTIPGGSFMEIPIAVSFLEGGQGKYLFEWNAIETMSSEWHVAWGDEISEVVVLNASDLHATPFLGVPLRHKIGFPKKGDKLRGIRIRCDEPVRLEYRDPETEQLIAVDTNGDGAFTGQGELFPPGSEWKTPFVEPIQGTRFAEVEVWIFPRRNTSWQKDMTLVVEVTGPTGWKEQARNILQIKEPLKN